MTKYKGLVGPNTRIMLGVMGFIIVIIFIADTFLNNLEIRWIDWIGWIMMFTLGATLIIEGIKLKRME